MSSPLVCHSFSLTDNKATNSFRHQCGCPLLENEQQFQWSATGRKQPGSCVQMGRGFSLCAESSRSQQPTHARAVSLFSIRRNPGPDRGGAGLATFLLGDVSGFSRFASSIADAGERQKRWFFMARIPSASRTNWFSTMDYGGKSISAVSDREGRWRMVGSRHWPGQRAGFGNVNLQGNVKK